MEEGEKILYSIINPSDAYTIEAKSLDVAFIACLILGNGQYAFEPVSEGVLVPLFLFGGAEEWSKKHLGAGKDEVAERVLRGSRVDLIECLESCLIGKPNDRKTFEEALKDSGEDRGVARAKWHEDRRSSMNDIGGRAYRIAANLRQNLKQPFEKAPQQVFSA